MMMSHTRIVSSGSVQRIEKVGLDSYFGNVWSLYNGVAVLYEHRVDTNLRLAMVWPPTQGVVFLPKADGIVNYTYSNHDDWAALRRGLCRSVTIPTLIDPNRIRCE